MKISGFVLLESDARNILDWRYKAKIDVETGMLWWKKKETLEIARSSNIGYFDWFFVRDGKQVPYEVNDLARSWTTTHPDKKILF